MLSVVTSGVTVLTRAGRLTARRLMPKMARFSEHVSVPGRAGPAATERWWPVPSALYGDWSKARKRLKSMNRNMEINMGKATKHNAITLRDEIKRTIRDTHPDWAELKETTIQRKGSSRPLIDHGDLLNSIKEKIISSFSFFVGVVKGSKGSQGQDLVNVAMVHEYGSSKAGIPMRSFVMTTIRRLQKKLMSNWIKAVRLTLQGRTYRV